MIYSPRRLTQFVAPTSETTQYTVPASFFAILKNIVVANTTGLTQTINLSVVPSGGAAGAANRILPGISILGNSVFTMDLSTVMAAGDFVSASASAASSLTVTVSGVESIGTGLSSGGSPGASVTGVQVVTSGTRPGSPYNGQVIYETDTDTLVVYNGSAWVDHAPGGAWNAYTPALTGSLSNPTLGTGAVVEGRWTRSGREVVGYADIRYGTSGIGVGGGNYRISLPVAPRSGAVTDVVVAQGFVRDVSGTAGQQRIPCVGFSISGSQYFEFVESYGKNQVTSVSPFGWAVSDEMHFQFAYEAAS